ncbi:hypothetical protein DFI02_1452 [Rhizobium sp. PP-F2F-G20b]|nr:hypothetical protein DFI02_1452 [Rhizobium sp. PP-F2F-G20b]
MVDIEYSPGYAHLSSSTSCTIKIPYVEGEIRTTHLSDSFELVSGMKLAIKLDKMYDLSEVSIFSGGTVQTACLLDESGLVNAQSAPDIVNAVAFERYQFDEKFVYLCANARRLPFEHQCFMGLITNLCFRISEVPIVRSTLLPHVYQLWCVGGCYNKYTSPYAARWRASSIVNLSITALLLGYDDIFLDVVRRTEHEIFHPELNPIIYTNDCLIHFVRGYLKYNIGLNQDCALELFKAIRSAQAGINDSICLRNGYILNRRYDVNIMATALYSSYTALAQLGASTLSNGTEAMMPSGVVDSIDPFDAQTLEQLFGRNSHLASVKEAFERVRRQL